MRRGPVMTLAAVLALAVVLGACGKRGTLRAPDDATEAYTYPRQYPKPETVVPQDTTARRSGELSPNAGDLSPFPNARKTTTYSSPAPQ